MASRKNIDFKSANSGLFQGETHNLTESVINIFNEQSQNAKEVETVSMILSSRLIQNQRNSIVYDVDKLDSLARDIAARGIQQPLLVRQRPDGTYLITSGHRRYLAAMLAGEKYHFDCERLPCIIRDNIKDEIDEREALIFDNNQRDKSDYNRMMEIVEIRACGEARRERGEDIPNIREYIMQKLEIGTAEISRFERIYKSLSSDLKKDFREKRISVNVAHEISKLTPEVQQYIHEKWNRDTAPQLTYPMMTKLVEEYSRPAIEEPVSDTIITKTVTKYTSLSDGFFDLTSRMKAISSSISLQTDTISDKNKKVLLRRANKLLKELDELGDMLKNLGINTAAERKE